MQEPQDDQGSVIPEGWLLGEPGREAVAALLSLSEEQFDYLGELLGPGLSWTKGRFLQRYPDAATQAFEGALVLVEVIYDRLAATGGTAEDAIRDLSTANARLKLDELNEPRVESLKRLFSHEGVRRARLRDIAIQQVMPVLDSFQLYCDLRLVTANATPPTFALVLLARIEADEAIGSGGPSVISLQITEEKLALLQAQFSDMAATVAGLRAAMGSQLL